MASMASAAPRSTSSVTAWMGIWPPRGRVAPGQLVVLQDVDEGGDRAPAEVPNRPGVRIRQQLAAAREPCHELISEVLTGSFGWHWLSDRAGPQGGGG